jgi:cytochrome oxidase Cu insertion factor (SCO1/SenC/PrrC family)
LRNILVVLVCVSLLALSACNSGREQTGKPAHDFSLTSFAGQELSLGELKGRPVMLYWFASW